MAVIRTGDIFKSFTFDGQDSRTYGIYITGEAVYNAPERSVEMISIPGRNGAYALDNGRFENIEVTYPAGVFGETEADFAAAVSALRNMLCSRRGYKRLSDDYNTGEYREAVYKSGLEVEPAQLRAGEFEITFECKPQRFLTSGENAQTLASGSSVNNPSLFPSSPLLQVDGYGDINLGAEKITVNQAVLGTVKLEGAYSWASGGYSGSLNLNALDTGDTFQINDLSLDVMYDEIGIGFDVRYSSVGSSTFDESSMQLSERLSDTRYMKANIFMKSGSLAFAKGTNSSGTLTTTVTLMDAFTQTSGTETITLSYTYSGSTLSLSVTLPPAASYWSATSHRAGFSSITGYSTISANTGAYIDLDIGEAWKVVNGEAVPINGIVAFPSELPTLKSGTTSITYDNTITSFKITPRWWKI